MADLVNVLPNADVFIPGTAGNAIRLEAHIEVALPRDVAEQLVWADRARYLKEDDLPKSMKGKSGFGFLASPQYLLHAKAQLKHLQAARRGDFAPK